MGCRLHWADTHKVHWTGGWFNWNAVQWQAILDKLGITCYKYASDNEGDGYEDIEVLKDDWEKLRKVLDEVPIADYGKTIIDRSEAEYVECSEESLISYKDFIDWFIVVDETFDKDNDYIRFTWF